MQRPSRYHQKFSTPAPMMVCGIELKPVLGTWLGRINGKRFALRRGVAGRQRIWEAYALPFTTAASAPLASGEMEDVVTSLVELWKHRLPLGDSL